MSDRWLTNLAAIRKRRETQALKGFGQKVEHLRAARQHRHEGTGPWSQKPRRSSFPLFLVTAIVLGLAAPFAIHHAGALDLRMAAITPIAANRDDRVLPGPEVSARMQAEILERRAAFDAKMAA